VAVVALALGSSPGQSPLATPAHAAYPAQNPDGSLGAMDAPVTVTVWADFQCPACGMFAREIEPLLVDTYVLDGRVRLVFWHFAFLGDESIQAATAAECAGEQGRFWDYHAYLFANQRGENRGAFSAERLARFADALALDRAVFDACRVGGSATARVTQATEQAGQAGVDRTPTLQIGDLARIPGVPSWEQLREIVDTALEADAAR
jgi:protein-disulfide isomerase